MGKIWKKLCALTGLFALLMFSPLGLLADPGSEKSKKVAPEENTVLVDGSVGKSESASLTASSATEECAKNVIPIILSADNNFAPPMYITMFSILKNSNKDTYYHFHLLIPSNFEQRYKDEITNLGEKYNNCKINFIDMGAAFTNMFPAGWPPSASYRLIAADLLPNYEKCLYIDVDVLVRYDLGELYNIDLGDCYIGGVKKAAMALDKGAAKYVLSTVNIDSNQYINSGVLLMNLDLIRKDGLSEKLVSTLKYGIEGKRSFRFPDQDVLNKVCFGRIKFLGPKYNLYAWLPSKVKSSQEIRKILENFFGKEQVEEACTNPCIVHFAGPKPWVNTSLSYADEWWEYTRQTPFHEEMKGKSHHGHKITLRHNPVLHRPVLHKPIPQRKPAPVSPAKGPHRHPTQVRKIARK